MSKCPYCARPIPVDATICPNCVRALPAAVGRSTRADERAPRAWGRLLVLLILLAAAGGYAFKQHWPISSANEVQPENVQPTTTIAPPLDVAIADSASATIEVGRYLAFPFSGDGRSTCHVEGSVAVLAGGDRRVNVFIVDADGLAEVERGRTPKSYFESGPLSAVSLGLNVDGRSRYTLVVANTGTPPRMKRVRLARLRAACMD